MNSNLRAFQLLYSHVRRKRGAIEVTYPSVKGNRFVGYYSWHPFSWNNLLVCESIYYG
ncbi:hypothetical protein GHT06_018586 [Daphnia sinensis]|uniref:Uncharacterized protein n=1 Tax=Daphnia sinensis TaxID=1820382 RepID=A0AAD5PUV7_9CRUS|nr:hypothetical protein GHT06_018586 [Daphnia sinensis]